MKKIEMFTTENCCFCPKAKEMVERYARENKDVELHIIDYWERKDLTEKYKIRLVPTIVVDGEITMIGVPNTYEEFVAKISQPIAHVGDKQAGAGKRGDLEGEK